MPKKKYQTIEVNGRSMTFNFAMFQEQFLYMAEKESKKIQEYEKHLASLVFVDSSTVHNWRHKRNCPGSIEIIQTIANYWKIPVERLLTEAEPVAGNEGEQAAVLHANAESSDQNPEETFTPLSENMKEEVTQMNTVRKFTDREKDAVLRIYDHFLNYMEAFKETDGFTASMDLPEEEFGPTDEAYTKMKEELVANLKHAVYREYIDLRDTVYEDLKFLVDNGVDYVIDYELEDEDDESYFLAIYVGTMEYFQSIIDPYL